MCPVPNSSWYLASNIFLPSHHNAPLSETCELVWSVSWLLWLLLIGPIILEVHMRGQNYPEFLQNELPELEDVPLATRIAMYFQHDGAPPHHTRYVMHLNDTFPNRCIGRGSTINWPPRSPDLIPLDFCSWGWTKSEVYRRIVDAWDKLLDRIMDARIKERQDELRWATCHVLTRVVKGIDVDSGTLENLL
jgi:hypothetical protein